MKNCETMNKEGRPTPRDPAVVRDAPSAAMPSGNRHAHPIRAGGAAPSGHDNRAESIHVLGLAFVNTPARSATPVLLEKEKFTSLAFVRVATSLIA